MVRIRLTSVILLAGPLVLGGCAAHLRPPPRDPVLERPFRAAVPPPPPADYPGRPGAAPAPAGGQPAVAPETRARLTGLATGLVGRWQVSIEGRRYRADCSGLVTGVYEAVGIDLTSDGAEHPDENGVSLIYRYVSTRGGLYRGGRPAPGDLVFFHDTWDRNGDGRRNDPLTHVGLVEAVEADGTVQVLHHSRRGVVRSRMNLDRPSERRDGPSGRPLNDYLRRGQSGPRLMGELFAGYGAVLR